MSTSRAVLAFLEYLRKPRKGEAGKVYLPKPIFVLGVVGVVLCLGVAVYTAFTNEELWIVLGFAAFSLLGLVLVIEYVNDRIWYNEEAFVSKNFWGIKRRFTYDQITAFKEDVHERVIYLGEQKVVISEFAVGGSEFLAFAKEKRKQLYGGKPLPPMGRNKNDLFHGNVKDVNTFIFAYGLMIAVVLALFVFVAVFYFTPKTAENTIAQERIFWYAQHRGDEAELLTHYEGTYKIRFIDTTFDLSPIREICDSETRVTVYAEEIRSDGEVFYAVRAIECNGEYVLSFDTTNELHRKEYRAIFLLPIALGALVAWFIIKSVRVGRNPQNYSKETVRRFFQGDYINY